MSLAAPWALLGLLALPVLWWLHRRLRRPPVRELPSLMFLLDEHEMRSLPRGRRFDAELFLALAAAALLALAAANPLLQRGGARRVARVVVAGGPHVRPDGPVDAAVKAVREAADPGDEIVVVPEPVGDTGKRATEAALLAAARTGEASVRYVIDDRLPAELPEDVQWIAVGNPDAKNYGIVSASVRPAGDRLEVFANVLNDTDKKARMFVFLDAVPGGSQDAEVDIPPFELRSVRWDVGPAARYIGLRMSDHGEDHLEADDAVRLRRMPVAVFVDPKLPDRLLRRTKAALEAAVSEGGLSYVGSAYEAKLAISVREGHNSTFNGLELELESVPEGSAVEAIGIGTDEIGRGPLVRDLATAAADWVYPPGARRLEPIEDVLLARRGAVAWPVLTYIRGWKLLRLVPDPLRGSPPPVDTPFWPLLIDNLVQHAAPQDVGAGFRAERGLLDLDASRVGRDVRPFDPETLRSAKPMAAAAPRPLRPLLVICALVCMLLLWTAPYLRRRLGGVPRGVRVSPVSGS